MEWTLYGRCGRCFGWKVHNGSQAISLERWLFKKIWQDPNWGIQKEFLLEILKGHPVGITIRTLVGNCEGEVVRETYGGVVEKFKRGCYSGK